MNFPTSQPSPSPLPQTSIPAAPEPGGPALSEPQRLINIFIAPSKTFADLKRNPSWWVPWLVSSIVAALFLLAVDKKVGFEAIVNARMAHATPFLQRAMEQMTPEQKDAMIQRQIGGLRVGMYLSWLSHLIYGLIGGSLLMATFNFIFDARIKFKNALAIVFYGVLPRLITSLLGIAVVFAGVNAEGFDPENPVATNLSPLVGLNSNNRFLYHLLSGIDVFAIWTVVLLGIGFAQHSYRKTSKSTAIAMVAIWYAVAVLIRSALSPLIG